jgi:acetyl esterase
MNKDKILLEPTTAAFVKKLAAAGSPPLYTLPLQQARDVLEQLQAGPVEKLKADIEDLLIPGGPQESISVRIIRPPDVKTKLPIVMYFHGGGWILGSKDTHDRLVRQLAHGAQAAIIFVNYTPSPEAHFPIPIEEAYAATNYFATHGDTYNLDSKRIALFGDSVGGNMATVVALLAKERKGPKIDLQVLCYPVTDASMSTPSYQEFADGPWLTKAAMAWFWDAYEPDKKARMQPHASPLYASLEQLRGLPPALVITDENDVLRDEGEAYAHKLMDAGVDVTAVRYLGTMHDFLLLNAISQTPAPRSARTLACGVLKNAFAVSL